ncbi:MAG: hypothetical protein ACI9BW_000703 [Gammaproteobacteria bacterium]|jgi:hypothetical protein
MRKLRRLVCIAVVLCAANHAVFADHPSVVSGSERGGGLNTISASSLGVGRWVVGLRSEVINNDPFSNGELAGFATAGEEGVHAIDEIVSAAATLAYGLTDDLDLSVRIPWIARNNIREGEIEDGEAEAHGHGDAKGIGDLLVLASYRFFARQGMELALQGGMKMPTGTTSVSDRGERFETEFQPGSGSWDFLIGGAFSKTFRRIGLHANLLYNATTEGSQDAELGDALFYNLAVVFSPTKDHDHGAHEHSSFIDEITWDLMLELNGEQRWRDNVQGIDDGNSGGSVVYLSPGIRASLQRFSAFFSVGYPLVDDSNGRQSDVDFRIMGGLGFGF